MMIGGEFNTPADWLRAGNAVTTIDDFAAAHGGNAPVLVFVDSGGAFNNDTECVNGTRGNAADHLTKDVVPFMISNFGVSPDRANWGIVGWSMGGTCAVDLTVMHPELFSAFVDIAGDMGPERGHQGRRPSPGCSAATPTRGRRSTRPRSSPSTVPTTVSRAGSPSHRHAAEQHAAARDVDASNAGLGGRDAAGNPGDQTQAAELAVRARRAPTASTARWSPQPGKHDWPFARTGVRRGTALAGRRDQHPRRPGGAAADARPGASGGRRRPGP